MLALAQVVFYNRPYYLEASFESVAVFVNSGAADNWGYECGRIHVDPALYPQRYQVWCDGAAGSFVTLRMISHNLRDAHLGTHLGYLVLGEVTPYLYQGGGQGGSALASTDLGLALAADEEGGSANLLAGFIIGLLCALLLLALACRLAAFCGVGPMGGGAKRGVHGRMKTQPTTPWQVELTSGSAIDNIDDIVEHALTAEAVHALVQTAHAKSAALVASSDEDARVRAALWLSAAEALTGVQEAESAAATLAKNEADTTTAHATAAPQTPAHKVEDKEEEESEVSLSDDDVEGQGD